MYNKKELESNILLDLSGNKEYISRLMKCIEMVDYPLIIERRQASFAYTLLFIRYSMAKRGIPLRTIENGAMRKHIENTLLSILNGKK